MSVLKAYKNIISAKTALLVIAALLISGCASKNKELLSEKEQLELIQQRVEELYTKAKKTLDRGNYALAIEYYQALENTFPYGDYTEQAKLDRIFAYDKLKSSERAIRAADNFISLYPTHPNVDYAYYMKGVASFEKKRGRFERMLKGSQNNIRDPQGYRDSEQAFEELLKRYPNSKYAADARQRLIYIRNQLAQRELDIAQFYFDNKTYLASVNRCKTIIYQYETSPAVEGALELMEKAYVEMGLTELAQSTRTILLTNFPENESTAAKPKSKGWLRRLGSLNPF